MDTINQNALRETESLAPPTNHCSMQSSGLFDFMRRRRNRQLDDVKVPRKGFKSKLLRMISRIALAVLWRHPAVDSCNATWSWTSLITSFTAQLALKSTQVNLKLAGRRTHPKSNSALTVSEGEITKALDKRWLEPVQYVDVRTTNSGHREFLLLTSTRPSADPPLHYFEYAASTFVRKILSTVFSPVFPRTQVM